MRESESKSEVTLTPAEEYKKKIEDSILHVRQTGKPLFLINERLTKAQVDVAMRVLTDAKATFTIRKCRNCKNIYDISIQFVPDP